MTTDTHRASRTSRTLRSSTALGAAVLVVGSLALGACSTTDAAGVASSAIGAVAQPGAAAQQSAGADAGADAGTVDLVTAAFEAPATADPTGSDPTATDQSQGAGDRDRKRLRARLLHALHATWVTDSKNGPVTHQAVRGEVTAVSSTSITVKSKDGFSLTYAVTKDTVVRERAKGQGSASTIGAVSVGDKALVTGVGATNPDARFVVFRSATTPPATSPSPSATS